MKSVTFGEIIWDVLGDEKVIGGAPFNFAAHLGHLGDESYLISAVGEDDLGKQAYAKADRHKIKKDFIQINSYPTGACIVTLDQNKVPSYNVLKNVAYDNIVADEKLIAEINSLNADVFYFNTLIQRGSSEKALKSILENCSFNDIFTDINIRPQCFTKESVLLCLEKSTIIKISDEEAHFLWDLGIIEECSDDEFIKTVAKKFPQLRMIILTLGKNGSKVYDRKTDKIIYSGIPEKVKVVSTVGAGDCFGASFLSAIFGGKTVAEAISFATKRSNTVVASKEAVPF